MNKITIRRSSIVISNYSMGDCYMLEKEFQLWDPVTHSYFYKGIKYDQEQQKLYLPRSTDVRWLERLFQCVAYNEPTCDPYEKVDDIFIKQLPRDEVQKEAFRFVLGVKEYSHMANLPQQMLALNTGKGKTYIAIGTLAYTGIKGIIIAPSIEWLKQWGERITEYTDIKSTEICMIQGAPSIGRLLKTGGDKYKIYLASHDTISSYGERYGWDKISDLFKAIKVGYKIYDEAHLSFDNICNIDFCTNTYKTLYLTATPGRSDEKENEIYQKYMRSVPAIDLFDEENDPRTQYIAFKYRSHITPQDQTACINKYGFNKMNYCNLIVNYENFHKMMHIMMDMIKKVDGKTLVYVATNNSINYVRDWILDHYPEYAGEIGIYTSMITGPEKEAAKEKKIILSTTKSCGAAMDIYGLKMTIQLAEPIKSKILSRQSLGRTRDTNTIYLDIVDMDVPAIRSYYTQRLPLFNKYATKCTEVVFRDNMLDEKVAQLQAARTSVQIPMQRTVVKPFLHEGEERQIINPFIHLD